MQGTWKQFIYPLIEDKKQNVEEEIYHRHIENQLMLLGWEPWKGEIIHKQSLRIGNRNRMEPDILISRDGECQFVIEVKRPGITQTKEEITQLESYMRQLRLDVGIYIGERIEVFYDRPNMALVSVFQLALDLDEKRGTRFVELFSKEKFTKDGIVTFCEERLKEIKRQASLNKIKESLIADAQTQIAESLRPYLLDKYGNTFSEEEIKGMLARLRFTAENIEGMPLEDATTPQTKQTARATHVQTDGKIRCHLTRNADAHGVFNKEEQSLTVLKGSAVNPIHVPKFGDANVRKRDAQLAEYTDEVDGKRIVRKDVFFDSPSGAALFCVGGSANGWDEWKDEEGRRLQHYRTAENKGGHHTGRTNKQIKDSRQLQLDFWTRFCDQLRATGQIPSMQAPRGQYWYDIRIGRSAILISNVCSIQKNYVGVKLYIRKQMVDTYFPALMARRNEIDHALGCEPVWDANPEASDKTIALIRPTDMSDARQVKTSIEWMVQQTIRFREVFTREIKRIK